MIDEKLLIGVMLKARENEFGTPLAMIDWFLQIIESQPKISLENKTSDWIPVNVKEPNKYGVYLVSGHIHGKQNEHIRVAEYFGEFEVANNFVVTAWQTLPKPYEVEE